MLRRLYTFASALSLLLCISSAALWVRSQRHDDFFRGARPIRSTDSYWQVWGSLDSAAGVIQFDANVMWDDPTVTLNDPRVGEIPNVEDPKYLRLDSAPAEGPPRLSSDDAWHWHRFALYAVHVGERSFKYWFLELAIPLWFASFLTALAPAIWLVRTRRIRKRLRTGRCRSCGYDLRATPDRCPECGHVPERATS